SEDVGSNADLMIMHEARQLLNEKSLRVLVSLADFAQRWRATPTLAFTHYQPAQPVTVGRRAVGWAHDLYALRGFLTGNILRGLRGATGTQASFLELFDGDANKVDALEWTVLRKLAVPGAEYLSGSRT